MTDFVSRLKQIVGPGNWSDNPAELEPHVTEWRGDVVGRALVMLRPSTREQVADILKACNAEKVGVVPQGGNTGMVAGAIPDASGEQVLVNLSRLNRLRSVDTSNFSMIAEAGCILANLQDAASEAGLLLPLSLGGEGSCQIGGNLSTNAGGINVLRYGTARDLVLGVEVVLADGTVLDLLRTLRKDVSGYDLKHLFIGSEGTLGIITAAALKLYPAVGPVSTALVAVKSSADAVALLAHCRRTLSDRIQAFELISDVCFEYVLKYIPGARSPFDQQHPWYVLTDVATDGDDTVLENALASANSLLADATIAKSQAESDALWRMRHGISEAEKKAGPGAKHDVSVPVGRIAEFLQTGAERMARYVPEATPAVFGHVGDGNLHYNATLPAGIDADEINALKSRIDTLVYDLVLEFDGSISAEHGIGSVKRHYLAQYKNPAELTVMRALKQALDPNGILNPGKVI